MTEIFDITVRESEDIERAYHELLSRRAIIVELIRADGDFDVEHTKFYNSYENSLINYQKLADTIIRRATNNKYSDANNWRIDFESHTVTIYGDQNEKKEF